MNFGEQLTRWWTLNIKNCECNTFISGDLSQAWEKIRKQAEAETPKGQIRFFPFDKREYTEKLCSTVKQRFHKSLPKEIISDFFEKMYSQFNYFEYTDIANYNGNQIKFYKTKTSSSMCWIFYANAIETNPNFAIDLITFFFEQYILKAIENKFKENNKSTVYTKLDFCEIYSLDSITKALEHFGANSILNNKERFFSVLAQKHGLKISFINSKSTQIRVEL